GYRNAMPSLHMGWALLSWWYCRGLSWWSKSVALAFLVFTFLATLGTGEHYLIDLVVAFPFALMVLGIFSFSLSWKNRDRLLSVFASLGIILVWLFLLRFANSVFWISPAVPWTLVAATVLASVLLRQRLAIAVDAAETNVDGLSSSPRSVEIPELVQS